MDLDETWQVGLRPEKTKAFHVSSEIALWVSERARKNGSQMLFCHVNDAPLLPLSLDRLAPNFPRTRVHCPGGGLWHMVSHSRKISIKGSNFPKKNLWFVISLRVTGNVLRRLDCFYPLLDIPQIYPTSVTFAEGCTVFQLSRSECLPLPRY